MTLSCYTGIIQITWGHSNMPSLAETVREGKQIGMQALVVFSKNNSDAVVATDSEYKKFQK